MGSDFQLRKSRILNQDFCKFSFDSVKLSNKNACFRIFKIIKVTFLNMMALNNGFQCKIFFSERFTFTCFAKLSNKITVKTSMSLQVLLALQEQYHTHFLLTSSNNSQFFSFIFLQVHDSSLCAGVALLSTLLLCLVHSSSECPVLHDEAPSSKFLMTWL